jgi:hypothetical protein
VAHRLPATFARPARRAALGSPGRSALVAWKLARRASRWHKVFAVPLGLGAAVAGLAWAGARVGALTVPSSGWPLLGMAGAMGLAAALMWPRQDPDRWARGAAGERATAEVLRRLPARRWAVMHDVALPGRRANVDHLVIGPTGVWVVDTKAYRARIQTGWCRVLVGGVPLSTVAVRWEAEVVSGVLGVNARPVVAVHGRGLPRRGRRCDGVRVLPARRLVRCLGRGRLLRPSLDARQVSDLAALAEARFARVGRAQPQSG